MPFQIVPVIDWKNGRAVHAVGGLRDQYRPLRTIWQAQRNLKDGPVPIPGSGSDLGPDPIAIARNLRDVLGLRALYLADLDAIAGGPPNIALYQNLIELGLDLWVDAGLRDAPHAAAVFGPSLSKFRAVIGLETVRGPSALEELADQLGPDRAIFSLDLFDGRPRAAPDAEWDAESAQAIALQAIDLGVRRLIVLDLARVGTSRGTGTADLTRALRERGASVEITVGGGLSTLEDVRGARATGASSVLIGSALHDGRIGAAEINAIARGR